MTISEIIKIIQESNIIGITFHASPDGDALGSALGLFQILLKMNKKPYMISKENLPQVFSFLPYSDQIDSNKCSVTNDTDCVIVLDCGNVERINAELDINNREYTLINIDHHLSNDYYGDYNYVDSKVSAVGEIIFDFLKETQIELNKEIATCLYTSILTDTGSFRYSSTSKHTHAIVGELVDTGIDFNKIYRIIYENKSFNKIRLFGKVIETMELQCDNNVCFISLTKDMLNEVELKDEDTSDVISLGTQVGISDVTAFIKESDDCVKVSLRSKCKFDVRKVAEYFGGGGHTRAAGFSTNFSVSQIKEQLIKIFNSESVC
jgi:bifunctional oligoribonuclease and PAP phosphatase NrnA